MEENYKHGPMPRERIYAAKGKADLSGVMIHVSEGRLVEITKHIRRHFTEEELRHFEDCEECAEVLSLFVRRGIHS
jgi:hypothetical protein